MPPMTMPPSSEAILDACREKLPAFKVPAMLRFVPALELTRGRKAVRVMRNVLVSGGYARRGPGDRPQAGGGRLFASSPSAARKARR